MEPTDPRSVAWAITLFSALDDGGLWGTPRSGLIFQKDGEMLVLRSVMPWEEGMPNDPETLLAFQRQEYAGIVVAFEMADIQILDDTDAL